MKWPWKRNLRFETVLEAQRRTEPFLPPFPRAQGLRGGAGWVGCTRFRPGEEVRPRAGCEAAHRKDGATVVAAAWLR